MKPFAIEDLLRSAASDGGSVPFPGGSRPRLHDLDDLFQAWSIEAERSIECELLLKLSRATIARLLECEAHLSFGEMIDTRRLIEQIDTRPGCCTTDRT